MSTDASPPDKASDVGATSPADDEVDHALQNKTEGASTGNGDVSSSSADEVAPSPVDEAPRPWDLIGVLRVGDVDDLVPFVCRCLGWGERAVFDEHLAQAVSDIVHDGCVARADIEMWDDKDLELSGAAWAWILPDLKFGDHGEAVNLLRRLVGVAGKPGAGFDQEVADFIGLRDCHFDEWHYLITTHEEPTK